ncbi:MAG: 54S ribosomal protein L4 mitochondrial [Piccolia ochrophora]|nr:MAG: 54S ribosomal protein L4 mitochondrial [Piccolia ochrophora]
MAPSLYPRTLLRFITEPHASSLVQPWPPVFLAPALRVVPRASPVSNFSTCSPRQLRRDRNRNRGVSAVRRTGPRQPLSVSKEPLPQPVLDPKQRSRAEVDENHGLWQFFGKDRKPLSTPEEDYAHGRPWTVEELRGKSWEDLHSLWWICAKERNRLVTATFERKRLQAGYGDYEAGRRDTTVRRTQKAIKHVLTERFYAWDAAWDLAKADPEVDLSGEGPAFVSQDLEVHPGYRKRHKGMIAVVEKRTPRATTGADWRGQIRGSDVVTSHL